MNNTGAKQVLKEVFARMKWKPDQTCIDAASVKTSAAIDTPAAVDGSIASGEVVEERGRA